ncbi:MAG: PEGA domain-containing protein [Melioribacteraceae bacterium]|nr:PEGA domain-containing protein [Melioribacteraceae bacterium]MCF8356663.1 PEGA domain-containing protein [Melioribacteraceae bacterium]MCF8396291.1 PEGA domain-containing protein [Melioribacteraceae bacterium]MCF8419876.1 PEGA domain-containing protein [Melioribacteraceae bacterium]
MKIIAKSMMLILITLMFIASSCEKEVSTSPPEKEVPHGVVYIDSKPSNALIYVNGRNEGLRTPDSITWLAEGEYTVTLKRNLYRDTSFSIVSNAENKYETFIDYNSNPKMRGSISCITNDRGASIYINDSLVEGTTPHTVKGLIPGKYKVSFSLDQRRTDSTFVTVESSKITEAIVILRDTTLWTDYTRATSEIPSNYLTFVIVDHENKKWIGTMDAGVAVFDNKSHTWQIFNETNSPLPSNQITKIFEDDLNRIWIGTTGGLVVIDNGVWDIYNSSNTPMEDDHVTDIEVDKDGLFWVLTHKGVVRTSLVTWQYIRVLSIEVGGNWLTTLTVDHQNNIWIGTYVDGILKYDRSIWTLYKNGPIEYSTFSSPPRYYRRGIPSNTIMAGAFDPYKGAILFGCWPFSADGFTGGTTLYDGYNLRNQVIHLQSNVIRFIHIDDNNKKYICTQVGISIFQEYYGFVQHFRMANTDITSDQTTCLAIDQDGLLWVTTNGGGLNKYKGEY